MGVCFEGVACVLLLGCRLWRLVSVLALLVLGCLDVAEAAVAAAVASAAEEEVACRRAALASGSCRGRRGRVRGGGRRGGGRRPAEEVARLRRLRRAPVSPAKKVRVRPTLQCTVVSNDTICWNL
jgi:hypothetical protein